MRMLIAAVLAVALSACTTNVPPLATAGAVAADAAGIAPPVSLADRTSADEKAMMAVEVAYKAARTVGEIGVDAGLIKGATATRVAQLDNRAYAALQAARSAYRLGNAESWLAALNQALQAIDAARLAATP